MNPHNIPALPRSCEPQELAPPPLRLWAAAGIACCLAATTFAQQTGSTESTDESDDDTVVLSPFEVRADQDSGYLASTAQSGTRLRTDLKDVASSISVVTKDMMNDIGAKDLQGLLVYTLGTEVNGVGGNFSDAGVINNPNGAETDYDEAFASASPSTRVRGLTSGDLSRDFFVTGIPMDGYNVERVEISRGPNAMLFGLGSPSGIINYSLITANLNRTRTELDFRVDQYGSIRASMDHNYVLKPKALAIRLAASFDDQEYKVKEAWRRSERVYLTATYKPFKSSTIKLSTEQGVIDSNLPEVRPPFDAYTQWWAMGRPAWDPNTNTGVTLGTPAAGWPDPFTATGAPAQTGGAIPGGGTTLNTGNLFSGQIGAMGAGSRQMVIVYNDPLSSTPNLGLPGSSVIGFRNGNYDRHSPNAAGVLQQRQTRGVRDWSYILNRVFHYDDITYNFWKAQQITDPKIFDFYEHMLHGPNKHEWAEIETYNATFEQQLFDGKGGAEIAFNRDLLDNGNVLGLDSLISGYTIRVDMTSHFANGQVNPNFGRPFTTAYSKASVRAYERDAARGTLFYDLDLRDSGPKWVGRLLGRHRLTASYTQLDNSAFLKNGNFAVASGLDYSLAEFGGASNLGSGQRGLPIMRYLGPDVSGSATPALGAITVPTSQSLAELESASILYYNTPPVGSTTPGTWTERRFSVLAAGEKDVDETLRRVTSTREKVDSLVGVAQSYWWDDTLVSTLGWRRDAVETFDAGTVTVDPATGRAVVDDSFRPRPVTDQTHTSFNYGLVLHTPEPIRRSLPLESSVSLIYNRADNFRPAGQRYNIYDEPLPAETGKSEEYGMLISTFGGRLIFKAAHYETVSGLSSSLLSSMTTPINNLVGVIDAVQSENLRGTNNANPAGLAAFNEWYNGPVGTVLRNTFRFTETVLPNGDPDISSDNRAGEVVATADVVSKGEEFEVVFNPTRNWRITFNANRAEAVRSNVATDLRDIVFNSMVPLVDGPAGSLKQDALNDVFFFKDRFMGQVYNQMLPELANEGSPTNELREWRFNGITNYTFTGGPLKGWHVGGGVRWQDQVAIGFPITTDPTFGVVPDVHNPYYGPDEINFDAWIGYSRKFEKFTWKAQLNIKNIGVGNDLIPVSAQPDGSIAAWRIRESQLMTFRSTFTF